MTPMKRGLLLKVKHFLGVFDTSPKDDPDEKGIVTMLRLSARLSARLSQR